MNQRKRATTRVHPYNATMKWLSSLVHGRGVPLWSPSSLRSPSSPIRRPLFLTLAVVAILGAIWSFVLMTTPPTQTLDQRAHDVASQLKCLICQGESVADSPAQLSQQMRGVIRQQLQEGKSEQEVIQYFVDRYGNRILLSPPWQGFSLLAWLVPIVMLFCGIALLFFVLRDWRATARPRAAQDDPALASLDETELAQYEVQLEQELSADDPLFMGTSMEAH